MKRSSYRYNFILGLLVVPILTIFLLTPSVNSKAASDQTYFPFVRNENGTIPEHFINKIDSVYGETYYYLIGNYHARGNPYDDGEWVPLLLVPKSNGVPQGAVQSNEYTFTVSSATISNNNGVVYGTYWRNNRSNNNYSFGSYSGDNTRFSNQQSPIYSNTKDFYGNFNLYDINSSKAIMLDVPAVVVPDHGHAQDPMNNIPSFVPPLGMHPTQAPSAPTYTFPTLATRPTWDTNHPFDSLFDIVQWGFTFSYDLLTGILQNIIDWATFFGNLIVWIYEQLWDYFSFFIDWLYRIFEYLFSPIYNFLNALFHDGDEVMSISDLLYEFMTRFDSFSSTIFQDTWFTSFWNNFSTELLDGLQYFSKVALFFGQLVALGTVNGEFSISSLTTVLFFPSISEVMQICILHDVFDVHTLMPILITSGKTMVNSLINVTPSTTFHVPSLVFHGQQIGNFDIDFSWYSSYKTYCDVIISGFLIIGWMYWVFVSFSHFLRGSVGQGEEPANPSLPVGSHWLG